MISKTFLAACAIAGVLGLAGVAAAQDTTTPPADPAAATTEEVAPAPEAAPAETPPAEETAPAETPSDPAAAPTAAVLGEPGEGKGQIVFFRPSRLTGGAWAYSVAETGEDGHVEETSPRIGRLANGSYFVADIEPGIHNYNLTGPMAVNLAEDRLRLEVEPGEVYYVEQTVRMGLVTGGFRLVPSTSETFGRRELRDMNAPRERRRR